MASDKTEKATPKKREDERKKGNVFHARDITVALNLLIMFLTLKIMGEYLYKYLQQTMTTFISGAGSISFVKIDSVTELTVDTLSRIFLVVLPLLIISALSSFLLTGIQTRFNFSTKRISFDLKRLNPINGLKRAVSIRTYTQLLKSMLTIVALVAVLWPGIRSFSNNIRSFYFMPPDQSLMLTASSVFDIFLRVCITVIFIGILDYFIQWWQYEKDIKMSKQEIKDEYKMTEGDPTVKSAIKSRQQRFAKMRMMRRVPLSDVIIVNPEHFAVALKYDDKRNKAPVVIAKGVDEVALRIKEIAAEHDISIEENPPLARALYKAVDIDMEIPPEFYQAVAEILSYVYSLKKKNKY